MTGTELGKKRTKLNLVPARTGDEPVHVQPLEPALVHAHHKPPHQHPIAHQDDGGEDRRRRNFENNGNQCEMGPQLSPHPIPPRVETTAAEVNPAPRTKPPKPTPNQSNKLSFVGIGLLSSWFKLVTLLVSKWRIFSKQYLFSFQAKWMN